MRSLRIGMRWWLAAIFVAIAVLTAVLVAAVSSRQADRAVRVNAEDIAIGKTVSAAFAVERAVAQGDLADASHVIAGRRDFALFVFSRSGTLLTPATADGVAWRTVPGRRAALAAALGGHRFVATGKDRGATVTALPLRRTPGAGAIVSYAPRPSAYGQSLSIFRREVARAALWAVLAAAAAGFVLAALIARRLRRIDAAAAAIERGDFDRELKPHFRDEVGSLALTIDRMRRRLRISFAQLRAERDRLERLFEQLHEGVIAVDAELVVRFANTAAAQIAGPGSLAPGTRLPERWADVPLAALAGGLFREDAEVAEARAAAADRTISVVGVPAGASELAVVVLRDITEQERRERAEREFVANASHELRTPVSAIVSAVEALQSGAKDSPRDRDAFVALIDRQATRLARLIKSLLLLARSQTQQGELRLEPVPLRPMLEDVISSTANGRAVDVSLDCPAELVALAQAEVTEQIVANLLENALKHTRDGTVLVAARRRDDGVVIEVRDEGPGIPLDAQRLVFDRFYSGQNGKRDGFGLGLAIVREAVRALGGSVEIESEPGRGTTARVVLAAGPKR